MSQKENLQDFYARICYTAPEAIGQEKPHVNVVERKHCKGMAPYSRRDFYTVSLILSRGSLVYADRVYKINRPAILFSTPKVPYQWVPEDLCQTGWFCVFNEAFARQHNEFLYQLPFFRVGTEKVFFPDKQTENEIAVLFRKMVEENAGDYVHKQELLRSYLHLIIHQVLKMQPVKDGYVLNNAAERITSLFLELLERQFPVDSIYNRLTLRSASDFARQLSIHTNHLNRSVKSVTGETTTTHIARRIILEAREMLRHNISISEVAYYLGFEYPAYFNAFYKKYTGITPGEAKETRA